MADQPLEPQNWSGPVTDGADNCYPLDEAAIAVFAEGFKQLDNLNAQMNGALRLFLRQHKLEGQWRIAANGRELERVSA